MVELFMQNKVVGKPQIRNKPKYVETQKTQKNTKETQRRSR